MDFDKLISDLEQAKTPNEYAAAATRLGELGNPAALGPLRNALSVMESQIDRWLNTTESPGTSAALRSAFLQTSEVLYGPSELMSTLMGSSGQPVNISDCFGARDALKAAINLPEVKTIRGRIMADMRAMRATQIDELRKRTLDKVGRAIQNREDDLKHKLDDEEMLKVLRTEVRQRRSSFEQYEKAIIEAYLPQAASQEEVDQAVAAAIAETGASSMKNMGAVMKAAMARLAGKSADGKMVSETVKAKLAVSA